VSRWCLDTSAYSRFKAGEPRVVRLLDEADWVGVPSVVVGELWLGFHLGRRFERNVSELREFLAHPLVHEIPVDRHVARIWAEIVADLRRAGTPLPTNDIWVAAAAAHTGSTVFTFDHHFERIARVGSLVLS